MMSVREMNYDKVSQICRAEFHHQFQEYMINFLKALAQKCSISKRSKENQARYSVAGNTLKQVFIRCTLPFEST